MIVKTRQRGEQAVARVVVVLDDLFGIPVTSGAVGVLEGRLFTLWRALWSRAVQLLYQAVIQPNRMLSIVHL